MKYDFTTGILMQYVKRIYPIHDKTQKSLIASLFIHTYSHFYIVYKFKFFILRVLL